MKTDKILFFTVSVDYINYLKKFDSKIPNIQYEKRQKFVSGVLFIINNVHYVAPVSSNKTPMPTSYLIKDKENLMGSIRFSFMFPVPSNEIKVKDFSHEDPYYRNLVNAQYKICNKNRERIRSQAMVVYKNATNRHSHFKNVCCNFKLLEEKCKEWEKEQENSKLQEIEELEHECC